MIFFFNYFYYISYIVHCSNRDHNFKYQCMANIIINNDGRCENCLSLLMNFSRIVGMINGTGSFCLASRDGSTAYHTRLWQYFVPALTQPSLWQCCPRNLHLQYPQQYTRKRKSLKENIDINFKKFIHEMSAFENWILYFHFFFFIFVAKR